MEYTIGAGKRVHVDPGPKEGFEFFYILSGTLCWLDGQEEKRLGPGDYFVARSISQISHFKASTEVKLLYMSSQPVFGALSKEIRELTKIAGQVAKKDAYTYGHSDRVERYVTKIGEKLRLSQQEMDHLLDCAFFHDIGKIEIPDEILQKPGKLTAEEWETIKKHPITGRNMLLNTPLADIADIVSQHHERIDGKGYPKGLKSEEICIEAKVIAVVDAFDAMTSRRPYRPARSPSDALIELRSKSGTQFDPEVVEAFSQVLDEEEALH